MIRLMKWTERSFQFHLPPEVFPAVLERLGGTPARAERLFTGVPQRMLSTRPADGWSAKEHIGHLDDLDELDQTRLGEFLGGTSVLSPADPQNRRTEEANHNARSPGAILTRFSRSRAKLVSRLEQLGTEDVERTAEHPRLRTPMRLIDWAWFVAEHDDHHLALARAAIRRVSG